MKNILGNKDFFAKHLKNSQRLYTHTHTLRHIHTHTQPHTRIHTPTPTLTYIQIFSIKQKPHTENVFLNVSSNDKPTSSNQLLILYFISPVFDL